MCIRYSSYFEYIIKKHGEETDDPLIGTYVNTTENRIIFRIKKINHFELFMPVTTKLSRKTKGKITKDENGKNVSQLDITDVV